MKKGLFVCYDPHALMQFLQFYCMNDFPAEWDVLCLPVENGEEYMHSYCEKTEIFKNIFTGNVEYMNLPILKKLGLFLYMFFFAIIGLRKKCCKNILNKYVNNIDQYDILCSNIDTGFISGMLANFGKEKDVVYFEDGVNDYFIKRSKYKNSSYPFFSLINLQCVIMAGLGYFAKGSVYFELTKYCYKYVTNKNALAYKNYKEIHEFNLYDKSLHDYKLFLNLIYPELQNISIPKQAIIFFTEPYADLLDEYEKYIDKVIHVISKTYKYVYIKKHPRDNYNYSFPKDVMVTELNKFIPAEVYFPFINENICCFDEISSVIIGLYPFVSKVIFYNLQEFNAMSLKINVAQKDKIGCLDKFLKNKYEIIKI